MTDETTTTTEPTAEALQERIAELEAQLDAATLELAAAKKEAKGHKAEARVLRLQLSPKARKIGPLKTMTGADALMQRELIALATGEGDVEIVASDGKREIVELAPIGVSGAAAWADRFGRKMLAQKVALEPGAIAADAVHVAGFGLLYEGEQIGWCKLPDALRVGRNQSVTLEHSIVF